MYVCKSQKHVSDFHLITPCQIVFERLSFKYLLTSYWRGGKGGTGID